MITNPITHILTVLKQIKAQYHNTIIIKITFNALTSESSRVHFFCFGLEIELDYLDIVKHIWVNCVCSGSKWNLRWCYCSIRLKLMFVIWSINGVSILFDALLESKPFPVLMFKMKKASLLINSFEFIVEFWILIWG